MKKFPIKKGLKTINASLLVKLGKPVPLRVTHVITNSCNLNCKYCYAKSFKKDKEMSIAQIKAMMDEFKTLGTQIWKISGGEPLIRKDIGEIIKYAKKCGFIINVSTNGTLVRKHLDTLKLAENIEISLDGPKEIHDSIRGKGIFKNAVEALELLNNIGIKTVINCVISKKNVQHINYMVELAENKGAHINFQPVVPVTKAAMKEESKELVKEDIFKKLLKLKKEKPIIMNSKDSLKRFDMYFKKKISRYQRQRCLAGWLSCMVSPEGYVGRCINLLGNNYNNGLKKGFKKAFAELSKKDKCDCTFCCYYDLSRVYSLNPFLMSKALYNIKKGRGIYS